MANTSAVDHVLRLGKLVGKPSDIEGGSNSGNNAKKDSKSLAGSLKRLVGIDLGLGALLKQSQIFTGYMGNLFSIVGAIIDTVLAPLAPVAFKALAALGKKIPAIAAMAEKHIPKIITWVQKTSISINEFLKKWVHVKWAQKLGLVIAGITAVNLSVKMLMMTGRFAGSVTGLRATGGIAKGVYGRIAGQTASRAAATSVLGATAAAGGVAAAAGGVDKYGRARGEPSGASSGANMSAGKTAGRFARFSRIAGMGAKRVPILGAVIGGGMSYAGGRSQGMSQGKSIARGGFTAGGALAGAASGAMVGAALGSIVPILGNAVGAALGGIVGGIVGGYGGEKIFDSLFNKGGKNGGGGTANLGVGAGIGLSGYSVPTFVAESAEAFSKTVLDHQLVVDSNAVALAALELASGGVRGEFDYVQTSANGAASALDSFSRKLEDYRVGVVNEQLLNSTGTLGNTFDGGAFVPKGALAASGGIGQVDDGGLGGGTPVSQGFWPEKHTKSNFDQAAFDAGRARSKELERQENERIAKAERDRISAENMAFDKAESDKFHKAFLADQPTGITKKLLESTGTLGSTVIYPSDINATGGLGQQDDGSGGYLAPPIVVNVISSSGNKIETSVARKVGSSWASTYGGEEEWM